MPCSPYVYGLCNFTSVAVGTKLYVLGGYTILPSRAPLLILCCVPLRFPQLQLAPSRSHALSSREFRLCSGLELGPDHSRQGSRMSAVERYDIERDEWVALDGLPSLRAGCVGFLVGEGEEREFWVMGGYGESRTLSGVFPVDEYYRDAVAMELKNNGAGNWREVGDMWAEGERPRVGKIAVVENEESGCSPAIFMLARKEILRYDMDSNHWQKESSVPRKALCNSSFGFVVLGGELYVMSLLHGVDSTETRRSCQLKKTGTLLFQIYHPMKKTWRSLLAKPPFHCPLDFKTAVLCIVRL